MQRVIAHNAHRVHYAAVDTALLPDSVWPPAVDDIVDGSVAGERGRDRGGGSSGSDVGERGRDRGGGSSGSDVGGRSGAARRGADAVDVLLEAAHARSLRPELIAHGMALQQVEGRRRDSVEQELRAIVANIPPPLETQLARHEEAHTASKAWHKSEHPKRAAQRTSYMYMYGYCGHSGYLPGDCTNGTAGRLPLQNTTGLLAVKGMLTAFGLDERAKFRWPSGVQTPASITDCADFCRGCARCNYISYNLLHGYCEWYQECDTARLLDIPKPVFGGYSYLTRQVGKVK